MFTAAVKGTLAVSTAFHVVSQLKTYIHATDTTVTDVPESSLALDLLNTWEVHQQVIFISHPSLKPNIEHVCACVLHFPNLLEKDCQKLVADLFEAIAAFL